MLFPALAWKENNQFSRIRKERMMDKMPPQAITSNKTPARNQAARNKNRMVVMEQLYLWSQETGKHIVNTRYMPDGLATQSLLALEQYSY